MEDNDYKMAFEIISEAGDSKAESMEAIECAKNREFETAGIHMKNAQDKMNKVHDIQSGMFAKEAEGEPIQVNIILVHAQDHLSMCMMAYDNAEMMIKLYKELEEMQTKLDNLLTKK